MPCGHPLAARMIENYIDAKTGGGLRLQTVCWACKIEKPDNRRNADRENR